MRRIAAGPLPQRVRALTAAVVSAALVAACAGAPPAPPPRASPPDQKVAEAPTGDLDRDCDRIADRDDRCPEEAEDYDGFEDSDGCPDPDNDRDGIPDACDKCPGEPELVNGYQDEDGCPDPLRVRINNQEIRIIPMIHFARGQTTPLPDGKPVLEVVRDTMRAHPELTRVAIIGHSSKDEPNGDKLSEARARKVVEALVALGVEPGRLEARGVGSRMPLVQEPEGREKNRRAEFLLVEREQRPLQRWTGGAYEPLDPPPAAPTSPPPPPSQPKCTAPPPAPLPKVPCRVNRGGR